jgi:hypothetical protein
MAKGELGREAIVQTLVLSVVVRTSEGKLNFPGETLKEAILIDNVGIENGIDCRLSLLGGFFEGGPQAGGLATTGTLGGLQQEVSQGGNGHGQSGNEDQPGCDGKVSATIPAALMV